MTADEMRDQLAEQAWGVLVAAGLRDETRGPSPSVIAHAIVENILPTVRKLIADELRAAAEAITENGRPDLTTVQQVQAVNEAAQWLDDRADALDPS